VLQKTRPTERLVELKVRVLTTGDTESHKGKSPGTPRLFFAAPMLGHRLSKESSEIEMGHGWRVRLVYAWTITICSLEMPPRA
jgi:hypothetical protein